MESSEINAGAHVINASEASYESCSAERDNERPRFLKRYRIIKTSAMVFIWLCMGCYSTMNNTAIDDLRELIGVKYEKFTRAFIAKSAGMLVGSFLAGPLADTCPAKIDVILAVAMAVMSGAALVLPLCPSLPVMGLSFGLQGVGQAALSASGNAHVMSIWGQENSSPVLSLHFGYALGNVVGPILVGPFLKEVPGNTTTNDTKSSYPTQYLMPHTYALYGDVVEETLVSSNHSQSEIWIPYVASGSVGLLVAFTFLIFFFVGLPEEYQSGHRESNSNDGATRFILSPGACTNGQVIYGLQFFLLLVLFYITNVGKDASFLTFILPIAIDKRVPLHFTKKAAAVLMLVNSACGALGRFTSAFAAKFLSIQVIVFVQIAFIVGAQVGLLVWGLEYVIVYWVASCVFNTFSSPLFPSVLAWADKYVKMTAVAVALVDVATGIGAFTFAWLAGYVFDNRADGAKWVLYLSTGCCISMAMFMMMLQILGSCHGSRHSIQSIPVTPSDDDDDTEPLVA